MKRIKNIGLIALAGLLIFVMTAVGLPFGVSENTAYAADEKTWPHEPEVTYITRKTIKLGKYPQYDKDNDGYIDWDDATPIKWQILDDPSDPNYDPTNVLVMADEILDVMPYNSERTDVTWETCLLRSWLNGTGTYEGKGFYYKVFSPEEQNYIKLTEGLQTEQVGTTDKLITNDKVYLLSYDEVTNSSYNFSSNAKYFDCFRVAEFTDYAYKHLSYGRDEPEYWLRSPGENNSRAMYVTEYGYLSEDGYYVDDINYGLRPVMHINLEAFLDSSQISEKIVGVENAVYDTITLGTYGGYSIKWNILKIDGSKALLLSKNVILQKAYNDGHANINWEDCTLRSWLNGEFYNSFTNDEKSAIIETEVVTNDSASATGEITTQDYIFLPSIEDMTNLEYGFENSKMTSGNTRRAYLLDGSTEIKNYWLRNQSDVGADLASLVGDDFFDNYGIVYPSGAIVVMTDCGVRPMMWVDLGELGYPVPVSGVSLDETSIVLQKNETFQLTATVSPAEAKNKNVTWSSSDESIATVSNTGLVTAVDCGTGVGTATITVTTEDGGKEATCTVKVYPGNRDRTAVMSWPDNPRITRNDAGEIENTDYDTIVLGEYGGTPIVWRVLQTDGDNALIFADDVICDRAYHSRQWDNPTWAVCDLRDWLNGTGIYAEGGTSAGEGFIDTASFSNKEKAAILTTQLTTFNRLNNTTENTSDRVFLLSIEDLTNEEYGFPNNPDAMYSFGPSKIRKASNDYWTRSKGIAEPPSNVIVGNVSFGEDPGKISFSSGVVTVDESRIGVRPAMWVNLKDLGYKKHVDSVVLSQTSLNMKIGDEETLTATVTPDDAADTSVTWSTNKPTVATVEDGKVKAVGEGTATITVTTVDGGKTATCEVTVTKLPEPTPKHEDYKMDPSSSDKLNWQSGSGKDFIITIKTAEGEDDSFNHFKDVELDGKLLKRDVDYTAKPGSTIITIKASVLEALEPGEHTLSVIFDNGRYETKFNILPKEDKKNDDNKKSDPVSTVTPDTGDSGYMPWLMTLLVSAGIATVIKVRRTIKGE